MIRNRLSAQNSRDKKKKEQQDLVEENNALRDENATLKRELEESRRYIEDLKKLTHCSTCHGQLSQPIQSEDSGTESELFSPSRKSSFKGIFSTFAFVGLIALICIMGPTTTFDQKQTNFGAARNLLALAPAMKAPRYETVLFDSKFHAFQYNNSMFLISSLLMKNFNDNYLQKYLTYQQEESINNLIVDPKENFTQNYYKRDLTDRDLKLPSSNIMIEETKENTNTSTLFCSSGFEVFSKQLSVISPLFF